MPILSCRCVITQCERGVETDRRRTWIEARDFRALALAATRTIARTPALCAYALFVPDIPRGGVFLEVVSEDGSGWRSSALVGPMGGPRPPDGCSSERFCRFEELMTIVGFERDPGAWAHGRYLAIVKHAAIWDVPTDVPARGDHESAEAYRKRCEAIDHVRIERARHEGMHVLRYPVAPARWRAQDLERMMALAYRLLPSSEPRWRESGAIVREEVAPSGNASGTASGNGSGHGSGRGSGTRCGSDAAGSSPRRARRVGQGGRAGIWLQVARGQYVASVSLPRFPGRAVSEWIGGRRGEVTLYHPIVQLERTARTVPATGLLSPLASLESVHVDSLM